MSIRLREVISRTDRASLYIHIPFCRSRCSYCVFFSSIDNPCLRSRYVHRLADELKLMNQVSIPTIYIGGGDPSLLNREELTLLLEAIAPLAGDAREVTIEMNPEGITEETLQVLGWYPVTRISIGIQSFNQHVRTLLGRQGSVSQVMHSLDLVRSHSDLDVSADIITGVEGTDEELTLDDLTLLVNRWSPEHISVYELDVEEGSELEARGVLPSEHDHLTPAWNLLQQLGYEHYELSNFSRPGKQGQHNLRYWTLKPYIGIGCSAVTTACWEGSTVRITGNRDIREFIQIGTDGASVEIIDAPTRFRELIMVSLRTASGIPMDVITEHYGSKAAEAVRRECRLLEQQGMMKCCSLTTYGMLVMNRVTLRFFELADELQQKQLLKY